MSNPNNLRTCKVDGCDRRWRAKGLCDKHYMAARSGSDGVHLGQGGRKLTAEQCAAIKKRSSQFASNVAIAKEFGVSAPVIAKVLSGAYAPKADA